MQPRKSKFKNPSKNEFKNRTWNSTREDNGRTPAAESARRRISFEATNLIGSSQDDVKVKYSVAAKRVHSSIAIQKKNRKPDWGALTHIECGSRIRFAR